jgi:Transposase DDE domain
VELTPDNVGDVSEVPDLLDQIDAEVASLTADGAYDGKAVYDAMAERHPSAMVIIPPRVTSVADETIAQRDRHLALIDERGRMGGQRRSGYNRRSLVETAMFATRPSLAGDFRPEPCPIRRSSAMCLIG